MSNEWITWVLKDAPLQDTSEVFMMLVLADSSNTDGICYPSKKTMAKYMRMTTRSVARLIANLEEKTLVQRQTRKRDSDGGQTSNYYQLYQRTEAEVKEAVRIAELRKKGEGMTPMTSPHDAHVIPPYDMGDIPPMTPMSSQEPLVEPKERSLKESTTISAIAESAVSTSPDNWSLADEASDAAMFPVKGKKQISAQAENGAKRLSKDTTPPIPSSAQPLPPVVAHVLTVEDENAVDAAPVLDKKGKARKPNEGYELGIALGDAWGIPPAKSEINLYVKQAKLLAQDVPVEDFKAFCDWRKKEAGDWADRLTIGQLLGKGYVSKYLQLRAEKAKELEAAQKLRDSIPPEYLPRVVPPEKRASPEQIAEALAAFNTPIFKAANMREDVS